MCGSSRAMCSPTCFVALCAQLFALLLAASAFAACFAGASPILAYRLLTHVLGVVCAICYSGSPPSPKSALSNVGGIGSSSAES